MRWTCLLLGLDVGWPNIGGGLGGCSVGVASDGIVVGYCCWSLQFVEGKEIEKWVVGWDWNEVCWPYQVWVFFHWKESWFKGGPYPIGTHSYCINWVPKGGKYGWL